MLYLKMFQHTESPVGLSTEIGEIQLIACLLVLQTDYAVTIGVEHSSRLNYTQLTLL
jgi:hypothetical protein